MRIHNPPKKHHHAPSQQEGSAHIMQQTVRTQGLISVNERKQREWNKNKSGVDLGFKYRRKGREKGTDQNPER